jgi:hypothetical protein
MLLAKDVKAKFDCWDAKKCPRRRWDAKNKASRNERYVRNYRKRSVKAHIEKVGGEALLSGLLAKIGSGELLIVHAPPTPRLLQVHQVHRTAKAVRILSLVGRWLLIVGRCC